MLKSGVFLVTSCRCICFDYIPSPVYFCGVNLYPSEIGKDRKDMSHLS
jgi:hypothetical protein